MAQSHKLSLFAAIFVNINIMLGTGVFINTVVLPQKVGGLAPVMYGIAGLLMLPLVLSLARLMNHYAQGSFYTFGAALSPYWGFMSTWSYFVGKMATPTLGIHIFNTLLQKSVPVFAHYSIFALDSSIITLFVALNLFSGKVGKRIQYFFITMKAIPLLFAIGVGLWYFDVINVAAPAIVWEGFPLALPIVIFCYLGFEATCSLSKVIDNPQKNASKAILYSFFIVVTLLMLYQFLFYTTLGATLAALTGFADAFPLLVEKAFPTLVLVLSPLLSLAIATSALGGAYGLMYSNAWNLHTLASLDYIPGSQLFATCNRFNIPYLCIIAEGAICFCYLFLTKGSQIPLQYTSVLACFVTYAVSVASLHKTHRSLISCLGLFSCAVGIFFCVRGFIFTNIAPLYFLMGILVLGTVLYLSKRRSAQGV